jgi:uncharacterized protein (DUF1330 family)
MKPYFTVALSIFTGIGIGGAAVQTIHAQAKPPAYLIAMNEVSDPTNYVKDYADKATTIVKSKGARILVRGGRVVALDGEPPKARLVVQQWESMDKLQDWYNSAEMKDLREVGKKYARFKTFAVEGFSE